MHPAPPARETPCATPCAAPEPARTTPAAAASSATTAPASAVPPTSSPVARPSSLASSPAAAGTARPTSRFFPTCFHPACVREMPHRVDLSPVLGTHQKNSLPLASRLHHKTKLHYCNVFVALSCFNLPCLLTPLALLRAHPCYCTYSPSHLLCNRLRLVLPAWSLQPLRQILSSH